MRQRAPPVRVTWSGYRAPSVRRRQTADDRPVPSRDIWSRGRRVRGRERRDTCRKSRCGTSITCAASIACIEGPANGVPLSTSRTPRQRIDVRAMIDALFDRLLWRHIRRRAERGTICVSVANPVRARRRHGLREPKSVTTAVPPENRMFSGLMSDARRLPRERTRARARRREGSPRIGDRERALGGKARAKRFALHERHRVVKTPHASPAERTKRC